jgi:hypothetical protein
METVINCNNDLYQIINNECVSLFTKARSCSGKYYIDIDYQVHEIGKGLVEFVGIKNKAITSIKQIDEQHLMVVRNNKILICCDLQLINILELHDLEYTHKYPNISTMIFVDRNPTEVTYSPIMKSTTVSNNYKISKIIDNRLMYIRFDRDKLVGLMDAKHDRVIMYFNDWEQMTSMLVTFNANNINNVLHEFYNNYTDSFAPTLKLHISAYGRFYNVSSIDLKMYGSKLYVRMDDFYLYEIKNIIKLNYKMYAIYLENKTCYLLQSDKLTKI